ncbi:MAG: magnesium/cobalt transporter CorA [Tetrasphaera sp.]
MSLVIVDQAKYIHGERMPCGDLSDELASLRLEPDEPSFLWIGLKDPAWEEFKLVQDELGLHQLAVEDVFSDSQRAKIERYHGNVFAVLKTLRYVDATSDIETGQVMVFLGDRFLVTVRQGELNELTGVRQRLERHPETLRLGSVAAFHAVIDSVVDNYMRIDEELQVDLEAIESGVFAGARDVHSERIYLLKREVLEFKRAAEPLRVSLAMMTGPSSPVTSTEAKLLLRDVADHLARVIDHIESYERLLTDVLNAHLARVGVRQNEDMRKISAWVAIAAVPTMMAGVYGMNFDNMPELRWKYGYFALLAVMITVCVVLYRAFRKSGWL